MKRPTSAVFDQKLYEKNNEDKPYQAHQKLKQTVSFPQRSKSVTRLEFADKGKISLAPKSNQTPRKVKRTKTLPFQFGIHLKPKPPLYNKPLKDKSIGGASPAPSDSKDSGDYTYVYSDWISPALVIKMEEMYDRPKQASENIYEEIKDDNIN